MTFMKKNNGVVDGIATLVALFIMLVFSTPPLDYRKSMFLVLIFLVVLYNFRRVVFLFHRQNKMVLVCNYFVHSFDVMSEHWIFIDKHGVPCLGLCLPHRKKVLRLDNRFPGVSWEGQLKRLEEIFKQNTNFSIEIKKVMTLLVQ